MLTDPQKDYLKESWENFHKSLTKEQQDMLHFRLGDLIQYGMAGLPMVYNHLSMVRRGENYE